MNDVIAYTGGKDEVEKINTHFARIIVTGTSDKPYYEIMWYDPKAKMYCIGYSSYKIEFVFGWLKEHFEVVGSNDPLMMEPLSEMSNIERILCGDKEALVNELHDIVKWARELSKQDWYNITHDANGGLHGVIRRIVEKQLADTTDKEIPL